MRSSMIQHGLKDRATLAYPSPNETKSGTILDAFTILYLGGLESPPSYPPKGGTDRDRTDDLHIAPSTPNGEKIQGGVGCFLG